MAVEGTHSQTLFLIPYGDVGDDVGVGWRCCKVQVMVAMLGGDGDDICWCWMVEVGWC